MTGKVASLQPSLRFPEFSGDWTKADIDWFLEKSSKPVNVKPEQVYQEIGVRSHGKGIFHKDADVGESLGDKRVFWVVPDALVLNIVFAWEQAVALTTSEEGGFIASHRFPMFVPRKGRADTRFARDFFLRPRGKWLLELASPGGAGRNKTLGQSNFAELSVVWPPQPEQKKIADFLGAVDERIRLLQRQRDALARYKTGIMQRLFDQSLRFNRDDGTAFPDWEEKRLGELGELLGGGTPDTNVEEFWEGETPWISSSDLDENSIHEINLERKINAVAIASSATKVIPAGSILIVTRVGIGKVAIAPTELCTSQDFSNLVVEQDDVVFLAYWLSFNRNRLRALAQGTSIKGITTVDLKLLKLALPHPDEQCKIADALCALDDKIAAVCAQIHHMQIFKKGLLQQMFV